MRAPVGKNFSLGQDGKAYIGKARPTGGGIPGDGGGTGTDISWVPPAGYFADIPVTNMPVNLNPAIYAGNSTAMVGPFDVWGGSAFLRDFSPLGAQFFYSGGHENSAGQTHTQICVGLDFSDLTWKVRCLPSNAHAANEPQVGFVDGRGHAYNAWPDKSTYCFHTYNSLEEMPAAWGGGAQGSMIAAGLDLDGGRGVTVLDVSQAVGGYSILPINQSANARPDRMRLSATGAGGTRPVAARDENRQGWWINGDLTTDYTLFVHKSGQTTQYPALGGNMQDGALVYIPSKDILIAIDGGYDETNPNYGGSSYRNLIMRNLALPWVNGTNQVYNTAQGAVPTGGQGYDSSGGPGAAYAYHTPGQMGLQWIEELGCIVGYDALRTGKVWKLTPNNPNDLLTTPWTWTSVTLQHWSADAGGQSTLQVPLNAAWSKFRWIPSLQAFSLGSAANKKPQVIKL